MATYTSSCLQSTAQHAQTHTHTRVCVCTSSLSSFSFLQLSTLFLSHHRYIWWFFLVFIHPLFTVISKIYFCNARWIGGYGQRDGICFLFDPPFHTTLIIIKIATSELSISDSVFAYGHEINKFPILRLLHPFIHQRSLMLIYSPTSEAGKWGEGTF